MNRFGAALLSLCLSLLVAVVASSPAAASSPIKLPVKGGIAGSCTGPNGDFAYFSSSGTVYEVSTASLTLTGRTALIDLAGVGRIYFCFAPASTSPPLLQGSSTTNMVYFMSRQSRVVQLDVDSMKVAAVLNISSSIPVGWGGGLAILGDVAWLTGKYSMYAVHMAEPPVAAPAPIALEPSTYEPYCGDALSSGAPARYGGAGVMVFGSTVVGETPGAGSVTVVAVAPDGTPGEQTVFLLGPAFAIPFQVVMHPQAPNVVTVIAEHTVANLDIVTGKVFGNVTIHGPDQLSETLCTTPDRSMIFVLYGSYTWQQWSLGATTGPVFIASHTLGVGGQHHSCTIVPNNDYSYTLLAAGSCSDGTACIASLVF